MGEKIDWDYVEKTIGKLKDLYKQIPSQRDLGKYIAEKIGRKNPISSDAVGIKLRKMGITTKGKGGRNNIRKKPKSGRKCVICGKDPAPNIKRCQTCNPPEDWTDTYGFTL